jgi:peptide/nickel transport system substrate-binding protein
MRKICHSGAHVMRAIAVCALALTLGASAASAQKTLRVVQHSDLKILDPIWSTAYIVRNHGHLIYETLFALDASLQPKPQMVDTFETSPDGLVTTLRLREGLAWHDGTPVTSEDCIASLKRWAARDGVGQKLAEALAEYKVVDARTFQIVLKQKFGSLLFALGKPSGVAPFIMPKRVAETDPFTQITDTTGSGPFMFVKEEWRPGDKTVYVKNKTYKPRAEAASGLAGGRIAGVDRIEMLYIPDPQTQVSALMSGEIDMIESVAHDLLPLLEADGKIDLIRSGGTLQYAFRPNWLQKPFDNALVRKAAMTAMEQTAFLTGTVGNSKYTRTCKALFTCDTPLATDAGMSDVLNGDAKRAGELLKQAGYDGTPIVILQPTDNPVLANLAPVAKSQLERAGFKVDVQAMDWQTLISRVPRKGPPSDGGWHAYLTAWAQVDLLDPLMMAFLGANCEKARPGWPCNAEIEALRQKFALADTQDERKSIAAALQTLNADQVTFAPLGEFWSVSASRKAVKRDAAAPLVMIYWGIEKN